LTTPVPPHPKKERLLLIPKILFLLGLFVFNASHAYADVLILQNGDRLTGQVQKDQDHWILRHEILGTLRFMQHDVLSVSDAADSQAKSEEKTEKEKEALREKGDLSWQKKVSLGYQIARGNTDTDYLSGDILLNRNRLWIDEWTFKSSALQSYSSDKKNAQRYEGSLRYGYSLTEPLYVFARFGAEHDLFKNLRARLIPSAGPGYWIADRENFKLLIETGAGYQFDFYRGGGSDSKPILHLRNFAMKKITERVEVGSDLYYFPVINDFGDYRIDSDAYLKLLVTPRLSVKSELQNDYHSRPLNGAKKHDLRLISSLEYAF
jgi:putative salt-induced outer membrane protein YdiY